MRRMKLFTYAMSITETYVYRKVKQGKKNRCMIGGIF